MCTRSRADLLSRPLKTFQAYRVEAHKTFFLEIKEPGEGEKQSQVQSLQDTQLLALGGAGEFPWGGHSRGQTNVLQRARSCCVACRQGAKTEEHAGLRWLLLSSLCTHSQESRLEMQPLREPAVAKVQGS